jgi:hypothetical protein
MQESAWEQEAKGHKNPTFLFFLSVPPRKTQGQPGGKRSSPVYQAVTPTTPAEDKENTMTAVRMRVKEE